MCETPFLLVTTYPPLEGEDFFQEIMEEFGGEGQAEEAGIFNMQERGALSFRVYSLISKHVWTKEIKRVSIRQGS